MTTANVTTPSAARRLALGRMVGALSAAAAAAASSDWLGAAVAVPDVMLVNRDGRHARLVSEIWRDRVAVINFVFTRCSSFCGVQSAVAADLQGRLGERLGREAVLLSISVDPLGDDATQLAAYSESFAPGPHWWWLTGEPREVYRALDAIGGVAPGNVQDHAPMWILGPVHAPRRIVGLSGAADLERLVVARLDRR